MGTAQRRAVALAAALLAAASALTPTGAAAQANEGDETGPARPITVTRLTTRAGAPLSGDVYINERGQVAARLSIAGDPYQVQTVLWHRGRVTRLSPDGVNAVPDDLSDEGHVVGTYIPVAESEPGAPPPPRHSFLWSRGTWTQLSSVPAGDPDVRVNARGQVVLPLDTPSPTGVWDDGELIPSPAGAEAQLINDRGQVVGVVTNERGALEAATWRLGDDSVTRLGTLGGERSWGTAINRSGDIAGTRTDADGVMHAFLWRDGEMTDLGSLGGGTSWATDLNDRGDVVGVSRTADSQFRAFLWRDGEMADLGAMGTTSPTIASWPAAVNNHGQVIGYTRVPHRGLTHAFVWEDGRMTDIGALADPEQHSQAVDINDRGQIVGELFSDTPTTAVLWAVPPRSG